MLRRLCIALVVLSCGCRAMQPAAATPNPVAEAAADPPDSLRVYWIGHATALVRIDDVWIITDPVFAARIGGVIRRLVAPGVNLGALPRTAFALISHAHMDHLDFPSLRRLDATTTLVVPPGVVRYLPDDLPFITISPLDTWDAIERDGVRITAVPAHHSNGRYLVDALWDRRAYTGYVIEHHGWTVYFAGDTGYDREMFRAIGSRFAIDLALLPVGPAARWGWVHWLRRHVHESEDEAMQAFADLGARWMVPIHHGTFFRGGDVELSSITRAIVRSPLASRVLLLRAGQSAELLHRARFWDRRLTLPPVPYLDSGDSEPSLTARRGNRPR